MNGIMVRRFSFLAAVCTLLAGGGPLHGAWLQFRPRVTVSGPLVKLSDIADIRDSDRRIVQRLGEVTVSPSPAPGRTLRLTLSLIRSRLQTSGEDLSKLKFAGSSAITVMSRALANRPRDPGKLVLRPVSDRRRKHAEKIASRAIGAHLQSIDPSLASMRVIGNLEDGDVQGILAASPNGIAVEGGRAPWIGEQRFRLTWRSGDGKVHQASVIGRIEPLPRVLVLRHNVDRGHVIQLEDLAWLVMETPPQRRDLLVRPEDVVGKESTRPLSSKRPIVADDVRGVLLVRRGDNISVDSRFGAVTVTRFAKARDNGSLGDEIAVSTLEGRETLLATVTGFHRAEIRGAAPVRLSRPRTRGSRRSARRVGNGNLNNGLGTIKQEGIGQRVSSQRGTVGRFESNSVGRDGRARRNIVVNEPRGIARMSY